MASNITKHFKAKAGLRMAQGGMVGGSFLNTVPDALPTSMFAGPGGSVATSYGGQGEQTSEQRIGGAQATLSKMFDADLANRGANYQFSVQTNAEKAAATGIDPTAPYKLGGVGDPHASGVPVTRPAAPTATIRPRRPIPPNPVTTLGLRTGTANVEDAMHNEELLEQGGTVKDRHGDPQKDTAHVVLAKDEAVLPAKTVQAMGGPEVVEDLIESTNGKPVAGKGLREGMHAVTGVQGDYIDPKELQAVFRSQNQTPVIEPAARVATENLRNMNTATAMGKLPDASPMPAQPTPATPATPAAPQTNLRSVLRSATQALAPVNAVANTMQQGSPDTAIRVNSLENGTGGLGAAAKGMGVVGSDLATAAVDSMAKPIVWAANKVGANLQQPGLNQAYREFVKNNVDGLTVPTTDTSQHRIISTEDVPEFIKKMSPDYARAAQESPEAAQRYLNAGKAPAQSPSPDREARIAAASKVVDTKTAPTPWVIEREDGTSTTNGTPTPPPVTLSAVQKSLASTNDLQGRSLASEAIRGAAQQATGMNTANGDAGTNAQLGLRAIANNDGVREAFNTAHAVSGDGVTYGTTIGADGKKQVLISGGAPTKGQYVGKDGELTNDWTKTQNYGEGVKRQESMKNTLRDLQYQNALSSMNSNNPNYQAEGLRVIQGLAAQGHDEATRASVAAKGAMTPELMMQMIRMQNDTAKDKRDFDFKEQEAHDNKVNDLVKSWSSPDGKFDPQLYANMQKYASKFKREPGMTSQQHLSNLMDEYAIDKLFNTEGRHWLTPEGPDAGEAVLPQIEKNAGWFGALIRGRLGGQEAYTDPLTGKKIYQSDVLNNLSPTQKKLLERRVGEFEAQQAKSKAK